MSYPLDIQCAPVAGYPVARHPHIPFPVSDAAKKHDADYPLFALAMLTAESREAKSVADLEACKSLHVSTTADNDAATVRPCKG
jgi:hypothetical protein